MSLDVRQLTVARGSKTIVSGASLIAPAGAITGLIGPNGAGKSTLLTAILGLTPASGTVGFEGNDLHAMPRHERAKIAAFVEQSVSTEERLTVADVVALGRIPHQPAWASALSPQDELIVSTALSATGMTAFSAQRFHTLSGGEQQRVLISRALAQAPRLLLLDEPTSHLDIKAQLQLLTLLRRLAESGMTIVLAIHDLNHAVRFCDHLVVMDHSKVITQGRPKEIITDDLLRTVYGVKAHLQNGDHISVFFEDVSDSWN